MIEYGIVKSVETSNAKVLVEFSQLDCEIECTVLMPSVGSTKVYCLPSLGAQVVCFLGEGKNLCLGAVFSEVDTTPKNKAEFVFNEGENGGLIIIESLKSELAKMTARIDGIINAINNGIPAATDGGAGLHTSIKLGLKAITKIEDFSQIENPKIKH